MAIMYCENSYGFVTVNITPEDVPHFKELVQRGANLWPDAPPSIKEFADNVTVGHVQQDYRSQAKDQRKEKPVERIKSPSFEQRIKSMNEMYQLGPVKGLMMIAARIPQFKKILSDECAEIDDILNVGGGVETQDMSAIALEAKVAMADLLADIVVYCTSEAQRWGIPLPEVLSIVMDSNASKLGADGKPIKDPETGKFLKGPNYWKPEPKIRELLEGNGAVANTTQSTAQPQSVEQQSVEFRGLHNH